MKRYRSLDYEVMIHKKYFRDAAKWCEERWGSRWSVTENRSGVWACFWAGRDNFECYRFVFADDRDMMMFALRWS